MMGKTSSKVIYSPPSEIFFDIFGMPCGQYRACYLLILGSYIMYLQSQMFWSVYMALVSMLIPLPSLYPPLMSVGFHTSKTQYIQG